MSARREYAARIVREDGVVVMAAYLVPVDVQDLGEFAELSSMAAHRANAIIDHRVESLARHAEREAERAAEEERIKAAIVEPGLVGAVVVGRAEHEGRVCYSTFTRVAQLDETEAYSRPWACGHGDLWAWSNLYVVELRAPGYDPTPPF